MDRKNSLELAKQLVDDFGHDPNGLLVGAIAGALRAPGLTTAEHDVLAERTRQQQVEGWTAEHDDKHGKGELARAAACYALAGGMNEGWQALSRRWPVSFWPWAVAWWKPTPHRRDLVKAGALILAEIERLDRAEAKSREPREVAEREHLAKLSEAADGMRLDKVKAYDMTDSGLMTALAHYELLFDQRGEHGGSPGEFAWERIKEIKSEMKRCGIVPGAGEKDA